MKKHTNLLQKAWLPLVLLAVCLLLTLCSCNTDGQENTTTEAPTEEATKPDYKQDTLVFETFKDMQDNVALYKDQLPCVRSTKGYREVGKGAASYRLTKDKPAGTFIRVADGVFAQLTVTEGMTTVSPEQFGAYGNGETDDTVNLTRAIDFAVEHDLTLHLTGDYRTVTTMNFDNLDVQSDNARISYYGQEFNRPAVDMYENVNIYGKINIYADIYNPPGTHGGRCGMSFGNYDTGRGAKNCYIEHVVIWSGGMAGADAILMTGDSSNITFGTIEVPEGHNKVNVPIMMHWGNYGEHHPADLLQPNTKYVHEDNAGPTTHPHDIKIGLIDSHAAHTALYISACYNIEVDEVRQYGGVSAVRMVCGDVGFKYASAAEKAHGAKNIYVKKVLGTDLGELGIYINGIDGYESGQAIHYQVKIDEATLSGTAKSGNGICFYGSDDVQIGKISLNGFRKAVLQLGYANESIKIGELLIEDCPAQIMSGYGTLRWSNYGYSETRSATRGVEIDKMTVKNSGTSNAVLGAFVNVEGLHIKELNAEKISCTALFAVYNTTKNIKIDQMNLTSPKNTPSAVIYAEHAITADRNISVTIHGAGNIPATSGQNCAATVTKN